MNIFRHQGWHLLSVAILIAFTRVFASQSPRAMDGSFRDIGTQTWFWIAIAIPVVHQVYVWLVWRLELYESTFSSRLGVTRAFRIYSVGFSILFAGRLISIVFLALSNRDSVSINPFLAYPIAAAITAAGAYLFYSVKKYFTIARAYGIDHFDKSYNEPYVKGGIFRFTDNGMYVIGLAVLYLPGLLLSSQAALVAALFNHVYIWVHYYCTERPDMKVIYGSAPGDSLTVTFRDGRIEIEPAPRAVRIENRDGFRVAEPADTYETLREETVRKTREDVRVLRKGGKTNR